MTTIRELENQYPKLEIITPALDTETHHQLFSKWDSFVLRNVSSFWRTRFDDDNVLDWHFIREDFINAGLVSVGDHHTEELATLEERKAALTGEVDIKGVRVEFKPVGLLVTMSPTLQLILSVGDNSIDRQVSVKLPNGFAPIKPGTITADLIYGAIVDRKYWRYPRGSGYNMSSSHGMSEDVRKWLEIKKVFNFDQG